jgi:hypothetical protein
MIPRPTDYLLKEDGHVIHRLDLLCPDDEAAKVRAKQLLDATTLNYGSVLATSRRSSEQLRASRCEAHNPGAPQLWLTVPKGGWVARANQYFRDR